MKQFLSLQRQIIVFPCRYVLLLVFQLNKCPCNAETRVAGLDYVLDIAVGCSLIGITEEVVVFLHLWFSNSYYI